MTPTPVLCVPGIITPAADRYAPLAAELAGSAQLVLHDLDVYRPGRSGPYSLEDEVTAALRAADAAGMARFHYLGYSAGAAVGLALVARAPGRVLSLVVDEPPTDWSTDLTTGPFWQALAGAASLPPQEVVGAFGRLQVAPDVALPAPSGPPPPWLAERPAGVVAFTRTALDPPAWATGWASYDGPVQWCGGDRSTPHYGEVRDRLAARLPQLRSTVFPGTHHLASAGVLQPAAYAEVLQEVWRTDPAAALPSG